MSTRAAKQTAVFYYSRVKSFFYLILCTSFCGLAIPLIVHKSGPWVWGEFLMFGLSLILFGAGSLVFAYLLIVRRPYLLLTAAEISVWQKSHILWKDVSAMWADNHTLPSGRYRRTACLITIRFKNTEKYIPSKSKILAVLMHLNKFLGAPGFTIDCSPLSRSERKRLLGILPLYFPGFEDRTCPKADSQNKTENA
ncbi:MAG: hypothetical protein PHX68_00915 [Alphaproteobacteria bacterium]|nr:hypothetical protein [Alphaproteobacteria bacterium]